MAEENVETTKETPARSRAERRQQWWSARKKEDAVAIDESTEVNVEKNKKKKKHKQADLKKKHKHYCLFVGNLSYDITKEEIEKHFLPAGTVKAVRLVTDVKTNKSRGFAYVEFNTSGDFMNALSLHHTELNGRKINVEMTMPGKGTSQMRKERLKWKNKSMDRFRRKRTHGKSGHGNR
ncbi:uncharacterized RNA-binding protein C365.04c-like [Anneissia japonica]|uniref:uncharacterized RNA-binding protein C365.04c-like n=1 Tax=Anneissia japonica TaxID=1529436 RepID=UPI00142599A7|nr:uncharacterized RNA-binding protein C365.04c-like [Anneissia japonica]XP_033116925.1 uncharacterized RNA-binding protein C365.04c-like [Anneissia japonica]XP_033116926.1 uncharacterized RNA-binding protein C365.04c-like [Anneissia japonica]